MIWINIDMTRHTPAGGSIATFSIGTPGGIFAPMLALGIFLGSGWTGYKYVFLGMHR